MAARGRLRQVLEWLPLVVLREMFGWLIAITAYCVVVAIVVHEMDLSLTQWQVEAGLVNSVILGLLLGFRNRTAFDRWWEARRLWGQLTNETRTLALKVAAFIPATAPGRPRFGELLSLFPASLMAHLRGEAFPLANVKVDSEPEPTHVPMYLESRMYQLLAEWKRAGLLDTATMLILDTHLRTFLDVCGSCERIRNTGIAPSYKGLLRLGIGLNVLIIPWYTLEQNGIWALPALLLVFFFLMGIEMVDTIVEEPFGKEEDDLDLERFCGTMRESVTEALGSPTAVAV